MYRVEINIDEETLKLVLVDLGINENPPTITTNWQDVKSLAKRKGYVSESFGQYFPAENHVIIQTLPPSYQRLPLFRLQPRVRETVLHELRHAHQYQCWPEERKLRMSEGPYWLRDCEVDARKWAYAAATGDKYRKLLTVERQPIGAGMRLP